MGNIISIGCDWLTVTSQEGKTIVALGACWWHIMMSALSDGGIIKEARWLGYDGQEVNGQFYGSRADGQIMRLTGGYAKEHATNVLQTGAHCTRIDFQITERLSEYDALYGETHRQLAKENRNGMQNRNWPKIKRRDEDGDGDTITTGARSSDKYGRLYDKSKQSGQDYYSRCWRWEIEYKGPAAVFYASGLQEANGLVGYIGGVVHGQYSEWGFCPTFTGYLATDVFRSLPVESDTDKTLNWLAIQVSPSIRKLTDNNVSRETLLVLLGL